jgi:uncharacterized protein (TIGR02118 family)
VQKLVILIHNTVPEETFQQRWHEFLKLAEQMAGLERETTSHVEAVLFGSFPYQIIHELYFESKETMKAALASPAGRSAGALLQQITGGQVALFYAGHAEDSLDHIKQHPPSGEAENG